ncbi:related to CBP3-required for assembly of cytochrome bc1 complex [Ramularia collo-cygni]|uniref:Related to CBP3-required for assembly of cytochrome bc1 complex n=1 Tax=Ramularia collo-cygni TaxID=112498 RepID=A0A2D3UTY4_9PEZI|nr:related to CBP3-required for assembly of cytochrome bc1 complex [Ramularia collo-cygni]CZT18528.1 related to CBP3-required for assembly of cytochrome bc1 complex [Ramularia collo-cygni]
MATSSSTICKSCLRTLTRGQRQQFRPTSALRTLTTSPRLSAKPEATPPPPPPPPPPKASTPDSAFSNLAATLRKAAPRSTTEPYIAYGSTEDLFAECARQADYTVPQALLQPPQPPPQNAAGDHLGVGQGWWLTPKSEGGLGLDATFNSWAQVCMLHMYILTVRLRAFPPEVVGAWHQNLLDHFFYKAEDKMVMWHEMSSRTSRNSALKQIWLQWRGVQLGYDEGLVRGDAVFAGAVWRNLFKGQEGVDVGDLVRVSAYIRREIWKSGKVGDEVVYEGRVKFGDPKDVEVSGKAQGVGRAFDEEDLRALKAVQGGKMEKEKK